jgi:hypothetical protein
MDLATLQYPRHLHDAGGAWQIVDDAEAAEVMIAAGWALSPAGPFVHAAEPLVDVEALPMIDPAAPPVAERKKPGRPRKV